MNGATALDCENTISRPNSTNTMTIGTSQYFFSCLRNLKNSPRTRPLLMTPPAGSVRALRGHRRHGSNERGGNPLVAFVGQMHSIEGQLRIADIDEIAEIHVL